MRTHPVLVRALQIVDPGIPRVQLDRADSDETDESVDTVDPEAGAFAAFPFLDLELMHNLGDRRQPASVSGEHDEQA